MTVRYLARVGESLSDPGKRMTKGLEELKKEGSGRHERPLKEKTLPMSMLVIILNDDPQYQLLEEVFADYPHLKAGFTLKGLFKLSRLSLRHKRELKNLFGGKYSTVLTPGFDFENHNGKWAVEVIDRQKGFHQFITKFVDRVVRSGNYPLGSPVSTEDLQLIEFIMRMNNEVYREDIEDPEEEGFPISQELLNFISHSLKDKYGKSTVFAYQFVQAFFESLNAFETILIKREFGG